jgi:hypothetical protein
VVKNIMHTSRYTVRRIGWFQPPHGDPYTRRLPNAEPLAHFDTFDAAERHRQELEAAARDGENPFRFGGASMFFQSSLDGPRLHDWLMDAGIEPPVTQLRHSDWRAWWDAFAHTWNPDQLAHAWAAFDKIRFHDVAEGEPDPAFVVVELVWGRLERDWDALAAGTEGGRLVGVYRDRSAADAVRARRNAVEAGGFGRYRYDRRLGYSATAQPVPAAQATFFETLPVPSDVPPLAGLGYLVQRKAVADAFGARVWTDRPPQVARVPLALFATRAAAVECRDKFAAEVRRVLNPFVFLDRYADVLGAEFAAALTALDPPLPVPAHYHHEWIEWYDVCQDEMTEEQREAVWELCDNPLFEVLRVEVH